MSKPFICVFPGQGTTEPHMGTYWSDNSDIFKKVYDDLLNYFEEKNSISLREIIHNHADKLIETRWAQPAIYCYQIAASHMLWSYGKPDAVMGHSLGEYAAIVAADGMDMYEGLDLVSERGRLMQQTEPGKVIAVLTNHDSITNILERHAELACWIAAENDENVFIVAGSEHDIQKLIEIIQYYAIRHLVIPGSTAFHTPLMHAIQDDWQKACKKVTLRPLSIPLYSTVTGTASSHLHTDYLMTHMQARVRFQTALNHMLLDYPYHCCIEMGPHNRFQSYIKKKWPLSIALGPEKNGPTCTLELQERLYEDT